MLVLEFTDPGFGAVHMLSVACFMIQHGRYSDDALVWIDQKLRADLEDGISAEQIRKEMNWETSQARRAWKVTRPPGAPPSLKSRGRSPSPASILRVRRPAAGLTRPITVPR